MTNLAEYLESQYEPTPTFTVDSIGSAEWALQKVLKYQAEIEKAKAEAKEQIEKVNRWLELVTAENEKQIDFFKGMLVPFADQNITGKKKSIKLPSGTIGFRKAATKYEFAPELLEWVKANKPDFVAVKESVAWGELKKTIKTAGGKVLTEDGEVIPGVTAIDQPDTFYVEAEK